MEQNETKSYIDIKAYSKQEVADIYEISQKSLTTWLDSIDGKLGPLIGRFYSPRQVEIIFKEYGIPKRLYY